MDKNLKDAAALTMLGTGAVCMIGKAIYDAGKKAGVNEFCTKVTLGITEAFVKSEESKKKSKEKEANK